MANHTTNQDFGCITKWVHDFALKMPPVMLNCRTKMLPWLFASICTACGVEKRHLQTCCLVTRNCIIINLLESYSHSDPLHYMISNFELLIYIISYSFLNQGHWRNQQNRLNYLFRSKEFTEDRGCNTKNHGLRSWRLTLRPWKRAGPQNGIPLPTIISQG